MGRRRKLKADEAKFLLIIIVALIVGIIKAITFVMNLIYEAYTKFKIKVHNAWLNPETKKIIIISTVLVIFFILFIVISILRYKKIKKERLQKEEEERIKQEEQERKRIERAEARRWALEEKRRREQLLKEKLEAEQREKERLEKEYQHGYRDDMDGYEYEKYCTDLFKYFSWDAKTTPKSGDFGADVIAKKDGIKIVAQCKKYKENVGYNAVKEVFTAKTINNADYAIVITNSDYTRSAKIGANETGVILIRHPDLEETLNTILEKTITKKEEE